MAFRFRKTLNIIPGVKVNIGKRGLSITTGRKGLSVTTGKKGVHLNVGAPGTGISFRTKISDFFKNSKNDSEDKK